MPSGAPSRLQLADNRCLSVLSEEKLAQLMSDVHFRVSPSVLGPLGAEQLQDPALAVLELVKNSWDADATRVEITVDATGIAVLDDGHGMSVRDFSSKWLVIGASEKRHAHQSPGGRPLIGEKGLGRLATYAMGARLSLESAREKEAGFSAVIDWDALVRAPSLDRYTIEVTKIRRKRGTKIQISDLRREWTEDHSAVLKQHLEFLTSLSRQKFSVVFTTNGTRLTLANPLTAIDRHAEAAIEVAIDEAGVPVVTRCEVEGRSLNRIVFRELAPSSRDERLAGTRISLRFMKRTGAGSKGLGSELKIADTTDLLDRYQGVRIFRDGINVPPYGFDGNDWAGLEKQRTQRGGPTMVPGNSQLIGEVHVRRQHKHLVITAGRSGFTDQKALRGLAEYVRWTVLQLGTARRAHQMNIPEGGAVPARVHEEPAEGPGPAAALELAVKKLSANKVASRAPEVRELTAKATALLDAFKRSEESLRLYAQLASSGIAATSFGHELRAEFDVVGWGVEQISRMRAVDSEVKQHLQAAWTRISSFVALFKIIPVRVRRKPKRLTYQDMQRSALAVLALAPPDKVSSEVLGAPSPVKMVPAELDSILLNLVSNAVKAIASSAHREKGKIRVSFRSDGAGLEIAVADNGCGVSEDVEEIMFEPLEGRFSDGTGMGLPIVAFIAARYGGSVRVRRDAPSGFKTQFVVTLTEVSKESI